jgi:hypothetical protein
MFEGTLEDFRSAWPPASEATLATGESSWEAAKNPYQRP